MLLALRAAAEAPASLADCRARLDRELARVHERPDVPEPVIVAELGDVIAHLLVASLLAKGDDGHLTLTARGRRVLQAHPMGIDETVLMEFAEYRAYIRAFARRRTVDDPREARYDEGYAAWQAGQTLTANPYPPDTADHLAWENGWSEARDADFDRRDRP